MSFYKQRGREGLMQRSARPKSAKGKPRPTPPQYPREQGTSAAVSSRPRPQSRHEGRSGSIPTRPNVTNRQRATQNSSSGTTSKTQKAEGQSTSRGPDPSKFPPVERPASSLSKYRILPRIPASTGQGGDSTDYGTHSPVESEMEYDLMSSFAQQMILDSTQKRTTANKPQQERVPKQKSSPGTNRPDNQKNGIRRQNDTTSQGSPVHKKSKTSYTKSVFARCDPPNHDKTEPKITLALKLPDGRRLEKKFSAHDRLSRVADYAQTKMRTSVKLCSIYSMLQVPKVLLRNWQKTLSEHGILDRTMLYIEEKD